MSNDVKIKELKKKYSNFKLDNNRKLIKIQSKKMSVPLRKFHYKLENELFSEFDKTDWIFYFQMLYKETNGIGYYINQQGWIKEKSIYNKLMKDYTPRDIKNLIDFIFYSNQDIMDKKQAGSYLFSKGWIQSVYQTSKLWENGMYESKAEQISGKKRQREWDNNQRASNKSENDLQNSSESSISF